MLHLILAVTAIGGFTVTEGNREPAFTVTYGTAITSTQRAAKDTRPIVYRLTATWCGPCRALEGYLTMAVRDKLPFQIVDWDVDTKGWMGASQIPGFWWQSPSGNLRCDWSNIDDLVGRWTLSQKPAPKARTQSITLTPQQQSMYDAAIRRGFTHEQIMDYAARHGLIQR